MEEDLINSNYTEDTKAATYDYIENVNNGAAKTGLSEKSKAAVADYLRSARMQFDEAKRLMNQYNSDHPVYSEQSNRMNEIQAKVTRLVDQVKGFEKGQAEFLEDFDNGSISNSVYAEGHGDDLNKMYTNALEAKVSDDGELMFGSFGKYKPYSALSRYSLKDFKSADAIIKLNKSIYDQAAPLTDNQKMMLGVQVKDLIAKGGRESLMSLINDELIPGLTKDSFNKEMYNPRNFEALQKEFINRMITGFDATAKAGHNAKRAEIQDKYAMALGHHQQMKDIDTRASLYLARTKKAEGLTGRSGGSGSSGGSYGTGATKSYAEIAREEAKAAAERLAAMKGNKKNK